MSDDYSPTRDDDLDWLIADLVEDFLQQRARGRRPDIDSYAAVDPRISEQVRQVFPLLVVVRDAMSGRPRSGHRRDN